jgi:two-component system, response regulator RegA
VADAVLVVDDDDGYRARLIKSFERRGFVALGASDAKGAAYVARQVEVAFAVVDLRLPGRSGLATAASPPRSRRSAAVRRIT